MDMSYNDIYVLNPDYMMTNDKYRIVLYSKETVNEYSSKNWISFLHPVQALIFSFFTYKRSFSENLVLLSERLNLTESQIANLIHPFLENDTPVYVIWRKEKIRFPKKLLIPLSKYGKCQDYFFREYTEDILTCDDNIDIKTSRLYRSPLNLTLMLTNYCITKCRYCYADTNTKINTYLFLDEILALIDNAVKLGIRQINLIGGEVLLYKNWDVILTKLVECDMSPEYISTKYPLTNLMIHKFKSTKFNNPIQVSIDALSSPILEDLLNVSSSYSSNMQKSIKALDESGLKYRIATVLTRKNSKQKDICELYDFLSSLKNITDWRISPISNSLYINELKFNKLKLSSKEVDELFCYMDKEIVTSSRFPILLNKSIHNRTFYTSENGSESFDGSYCSALNNHMFILPDGKVTICEQLYWNPHFIIGNIKEQTISEIWNSKRALYLANLDRSTIRDNSNCKCCDLFDKCFSARNRCWVDIVKAYGWENWDYPDPRCKYAPAMFYPLNYK